MCLLFAGLMAFTANLVNAQALVDGTNGGDGYIKNGSFESVGGNGSGGGGVGHSIDTWQTGFNVDLEQSRDNLPGTDGSYSAVLGSEAGTGARIGMALNTGYDAYSGDTFDLSFKWRSAANWDNNDSINWRLFTTSNNTTSGTVTVIASGSVDGHSDGVYRTASATGVGTVNAASEGQDVWIEFYSPTANTAGEWARVDEVNLDVNPALVPSVIIDGSNGGNGYALNGSFENVGADGTGGNGVGHLIDTWQTGFNVDHEQGRDNLPGTDGNFSAVVGSESGSGDKIGVVLNTGFVVQSGDAFDLSFKWRSAWQWDSSDSINWRLFTTSNNNTSGTVTAIASGSVSGHSDGVYREEVRTGVGTVNSANVGKELWIEIYSSTANSSGEFARLDEVNLSLADGDDGGDTGGGGSQISLNEFSRDRAIFDAGLAVGMNGADVPLSGTATPGAVIQGRAVSIDDGGATTTSWADIATTNGSGNWSGVIVAPTSASWYQAQVRIKNNTGVTALMNNRFGSGLIVTFHEQSNLQQQLATSYNHAPLNISVPDPEAVQMIELVNRGGPSFSDQNATPGPFRQINDSNFYTTSMSHMAAQICEAAPGLKVLLVMDAKAGRAQNLTLNDNDNRRMWQSVVALYDKVRQDGAEIGLMVNSHKNGMSYAKWAQYSCRSITGYKLDGTPCPKVGGRWHFDAGSDSNYGDHIWADLVPGILTGRTAVIMQDDGYGFPSDHPQNHSFYKQAMDLANNTNLPHNPFLASLWHNNVRMGLLNNPSNDFGHFTEDNYYGKPNSARQRIFLALETIGVVNIPEPKFDIITWTPNYVQLECSAGPVTTIAKQTGLPALNSSIDPEFSEAIGFRFNLSGSQPHTVRIVNKNTGQPATSGVVRVYPNSGTFNGSSKLYFRALTAAGSFDTNEYFLNQAHLHKPVMMTGPSSSNSSYIGFEALEVQPFVDINVINNANNL